MSSDKGKQEGEPYLCQTIYLTGTSLLLITALLITWLIVVSIQIIYILFIFSRTAFHRQPQHEVTPQPGEPGESTGPSLRPGESTRGESTRGESTPGVSVIVCARNERENLIELLPLLNAQAYPAFEVLVMDDRSTDGTDAYLENGIADLCHVRSIRIDKEHGHITPKKYALTIALKKAVYPTVLLTDADCRPQSPNWLADMVGPLANHNKDIVLGFSPYERRPGLLNLLIRSETLFTAVQYFSLALAGWPYMGVGRNLVYRTRTFFANKGFYTHKNVLGGDDDLFINEVATGRNTAICLTPAAFTWSKPKETWADWRVQKRRHLNVGKYYKTSHKIRLGLLNGSHVLTWVLGIMAGLTVAALKLTGHVFTDIEWLLLFIATGAFVFRLLAFWSIVGRISYRLAHTVHWLLIPAVDGMLAFYYGVAGLKTLFKPKGKRYYWR